MCKKKNDKLLIKQKEKPHTFPAKNSLTPVLKLAMFVAWWTGNGKVLHMSTILFIHIIGGRSWIMNNE